MTFHLELVRLDNSDDMHHNTHPIYENKNEFIKQVFSQILHALNMLHTNLGPIQVSKIFLYDSFDEWDFNAISVISQLYKLYNKLWGSEAISLCKI